jgi:integrase
VGILYRWHGKPTEIGFGSARSVTLARARELAGQARAKLAEKINPKDSRKPMNGATFGECADRLIGAMRPSWRNGKHAAQWEMTLREYAAPLRRLPADKITTVDVLSVLKPLWNEKPETASRLRGRIERVLDAAKAQGLRSGENPARWRGHLDHLLAKRQRLTRGHHPAMPYADVSAFMTTLRKREGIAARALEFGILTAARSGEVIGARWLEFDLDGAVWTVPAARMKAGKEHRIPLAPRALKIVKDIVGLSGEFVFPGGKPGRPLSAKALAKALRRMKVKNGPVHGFRSANNLTHPGPALTCWTIDLDIRDVLRSPICRRRCLLSCQASCALTSLVWRGAGWPTVAGHVTTAVRLAPRRPLIGGGGGGCWHILRFGCDSPMRCSA